MSKPWLRLYTEFATDAKMQLLGFDDQRHYIVLLCLKGNGTLDSMGVGPEHFERMVSKALGLDPKTGAEVKRRLQELNLISESWQPTAWDKRQYDSDSSTSRVHNWRIKKRGETLQQRYSNVLDSDSDSDSDTDTEQSKRPRAARSGRLPGDWIFTPERQKVAESERIDGPREFAKFTDHWLSASGASARKLDWDAAWRNWCRKAADYAPVGRKPARIPKTPEQIEAEEAARAHQ